MDSMGSEVTLLSSREAILGAMSLRPNMTMTIHHIQRAIFLAEVGIYGDPSGPPTGYGFKPGIYGPVSNEIYKEVIKLSFEGSIAALFGRGMGTYISMEKGYAEGLMIVNSLSAMRRHGYIEIITWVQNSTIEELAASFRLHYPEFCTNELQEEEAKSQDF